MGKGGIRIPFNITEVNGSKSPYEWYAKKVKEFAKEKYGLDLKVEINPQYTNEKKDLSDTR